MLFSHAYVSQSYGQRIEGTIKNLKKTTIGNSLLAWYGNSPLLVGSVPIDCCRAVITNRQAAGMCGHVGGW